MTYYSKLYHKAYNLLYSEMYLNNNEIKIEYMEKKHFLSYSALKMKASSIQMKSQIENN